MKRSATSNLLSLSFHSTPGLLDGGEMLRSNRAAIADAKDFFTDMVDNAQQGMMIHQGDLKPIYINQAWAELHGLTVDEVLAKPNLLDLIHESERERLSGYARRRLEGSDVPIRYRYRALHISGRPIWLEQFVHIFEWGGERFIQSTIIDVDDQERKVDELRQLRQSMEKKAVETTKALKRSSQRLHIYQSVIDQVSERMAVIGADYRYRMSNRANSDFYRLPIEAFADRLMVDIVGEAEFFQRIKPELDRCFAGETVKSHRCMTDLSGTHRVFDVIMEPYRELDGTISGAVTTLRDVTEAHQLSKRLAYQARYDELTGLVNRRAFEQLLATSIKETAKGGRSDALCFIDLDQFKIVNDTVGHLAGDELLKQVAKLLSVKLPQGDTLARLGGDEFALLLHRCSLRRAKRAAEQLIAALKDFQFFHEDLMFEVGASIGITAINRHVADISDVMAQADLACYAAKDLGRNCVQIFQRRDVVMQRRREEMYRAGGIRAALDNDRFVLYGQPITAIDSTCQQPDQFEILLRMRGERGQLIMPSAFIPAAERYGFMAEIDRWVIRKTFAELIRQPPLPEKPHVSINLSGVTLNDETSLEFIRRALSLSNLLPEQISFEITETAAIRNIVKTQAFMEELRGWGCRFALDDFGSGLSSLNYLKRLPVDFLKIDGSFVRDVAKDHGSQIMVKAISQMAEGLGIETVAEGVEDLSTLDILKDIGIDYVQGFAIGRPTPLGCYEKAAALI